MAKDEGYIELPFVNEIVKKIDASGSVIEERTILVSASTADEAVVVFERIRDGKKK